MADLHNPRRLFGSNHFEATGGALRLRMLMQNGWLVSIAINENGMTASCSSFGADGTRVDGEQEATPDQVVEWLNTVRLLKP